VWCLTSLTLLNVSVNNVSLASMRHLALSLATLYNLRELNLQGNFLGRKSAAVVAPALMHLSHLHELVLGRNQFSCCRRHSNCRLFAASSATTLAQLAPLAK